MIRIQDKSQYTVYLSDTKWCSLPSTYKSMDYNISKVETNRSNPNNDLESLRPTSDEKSRRSPQFSSSQRSMSSLFESDDEVPQSSQSESFSSSSSSSPKKKKMSSLNSCC
eukprot:CAMPEP_0171433020 /NCGR_PEP_ID=MMETSP0881-20121228/8263_1 /TAXON_ID=67004 /ORGANISM="Thalassiosira weissflogii, Strain CCMP1336" /LENGTH=110 /DNA_ID=CAMNT_0011953545 /DNA_START=169 /DNA_END=498 /DNA_ORIENTATION=-